MMPMPLVAPPLAEKLMQNRQALAPKALTVESGKAVGRGSPEARLAMQANMPVFMAHKECLRFPGAPTRQPSEANLKIQTTPTRRHRQFLALRIKGGELLCFQIRPILAVIPRIAERVKALLSQGLWAVSAPSSFARCT